MTWLRQLRHQAAFDLLMFRRNPAATFFTVVLPVLFFLIFTSIFGNEQSSEGIRLATYYVPGILALQVTSATLVNLAITLTNKREQGVLKRVRGTPLRPSVFVMAQALSAVVITLCSAALLITIGQVLFDVSIRSEGIISLVLTLLIGAAALSALGMALTVIIPSVQAAPAITNFIVLPLYFISDVFIVGDKPAALEKVAALFPIQHLAAALGESFDPQATGIPWPWEHWLVLTGWGTVGVVVALLSFRWVPRR